MFGDEMASAWVQGAGEEGAEDQIDQRIPSNKAHEGPIKQELSCDIDYLYCGYWQVVDKHGSDSVKEDLKGAKEGLSGNRVQ
jgi:hypothetical protein